MIAGLDSAFPPTAAELAYAHAHGVRVWGGYFKFSSGDRIYHGWTDSDFARVKAAGIRAIAYCSGWDNPSYCASRAARLGVLPCLDTEGGIRGDGSWVQGWLDSAGAGLYGNGPVHAGRRARFHVLADYPGYNPDAEWGVYPRPSGPCGWQWEGTHTELGLSVDRGWFDDWFLEEQDMTNAEVNGLIDDAFGLVRAGAESRAAKKAQPDHTAHPFEARGWGLADDILAGVPAGGTSPPHAHDTPAGHTGPVSA